MSLCIGISGGHKGSQAIALNGTDVVGSTVGPSLNYHTYGIETLVERSWTLLTKLAKETGHRDVDDLVGDTRSVTFSLPGVTDDRPLEKLAEINWRSPDALDVVDDTWAGLIGGTLDRMGVCAIAGTGASVFVGLGEFPFPKGKPWKLDGFGPILGDWGSGFRLATRYFEEYGRHYDRFGKPELIPLLSDLLALRPDIRGADGIQKWFDELRRDRVRDWYVPFADLAAVVANAGERDTPDFFATGLVKESARQLARTIQIGLTRAERVLRDRKNRELTVDSLPIVCVGGQFWHSKVYCEEVRKAVAETHSKNRVFLAKFTPVVGAALMAFAADRILPSREDIAKIARSVLAHGPAVERRITIPKAPMPSVLESAP